jgi:hypothetical protein
VVSDGYVCPECGLDYDTVQPPDAKVAIRSFPRRYREALAPVLAGDDGDEIVRRRPSPSTWSALEYTAHVADLYGLFADTVTRMYAEDHPTIDFWDSDARAVSEGYASKDPAAVLDWLAANGERLAAAVDRVDADAWHRTAVFPWGERDILTMVRNAVHEGTHHLRDVNKVLAAVRR